MSKCIDEKSPLTQSQSSLSCSLSSQPVRLDVRVPNGHILCSEKWKSSQLVSSLSGLVNVIYEDRLGVVDFHPSNGMGVVYISEGDLVAGLTYKRRLAKLRSVHSIRGVAIAEKTSTSNQYFPDLQRFATFELGLVLVPVTSHTEAAHVLAQLVHVENRPHINPFRVLPKKPPLDGAVLATLQLVPRLGEVKAKALLDHFRTLERIANASEMEMASVVGMATTRHVRNFFCAPPT